LRFANILLSRREGPRDRTPFVVPRLARNATATNATGAAITAKETRQPTPLSNAFPTIREAATAPAGKKACSTFICLAT